MELIDPIAVFVDGKRAEAKAVHSPLVSMHMDVTIRGGLALVETVRTYKNREAKPIEALLSIPVPVHAAFFGLTAKIGGTVHRAKAFPRAEARETYEDAIYRGKVAVLHEELLRGVHALSVVNLAPRDDVEITIRWAEPLRYRNSAGHLRIPLTVGDVYGQSGLPDVDELTHRGPEPPTTVRIEHDAASVGLATGKPDQESDGELFAKVPASAPVDIEVTGWTCEELVGRAADGRNVRLFIEPAPDGNEGLDVAILVDHSGSMDFPCEGRSWASISKHGAVKNALLKLDDQLCSGDRIALWQFDTSCQPVGSYRPGQPGRFRHLASRLRRPWGGTEIGKALDAIARRSVRDVLLITDGKSYALDVHRRVLEGRRVFVVLVGEDSLEAKVGHLAAMTGGDLQFTFGEDVESAVAACVRGMRLRRALDETCQVSADGLPQSVRTAKGGVSFEARWIGESIDRKRDSFSAAVAAYAASLAVASSREEVATSIAVKEGLVTHLTSLFLKIEGAQSEADLPGTRKIWLSSPRSYIGLNRSWAGKLMDARASHSRSNTDSEPSEKAVIDEFWAYPDLERLSRGPRIRVEFSRDPLAVNPLRKAFGRQVISNLAASTDSIRGFAVLLLGQYFGERLLAKGRIRDEEVIDVFLRVEQVCGYASCLALESSVPKSGRIPGIGRIRKRIAERNKTVRIGITPDAMILSDQKTNGVWGLFSASARKSRLIANGPVGLSTEARKFVAEAYLDRFDESVLDRLEDLFAYGGRLSLEPRPDALQTLGRILGPPTSQRERHFYRRYVCDGEHCDELPSGRQGAFRRLLESHSNLYRGINREELIAIRREARKVDVGLATRIGHILALEALLAPSEVLFGFIQTRHGRAPSEVEATLRERWDAGVPHLDAGEFREIADKIESVVGRDVVIHMAGVHDGLIKGEYRSAIEHLVEWNRLVSRRRYTSSWVQLDDRNVLNVRHRGTECQLPKPRDLVWLWRDGYHINTLKTLVARTAELPRREARRLLPDEYFRTRSWT